MPNESGLEYPPPTPVYFEERKTANFAPQSGDCAT